MRRLLDAVLARLPHAERRVVDRLVRGRLWRKLANYLVVEAQIAAGWTSMPLGKPYWLTVDPTNFCQLQCPFCPTGAGRGVREKASLRLEHFGHLMDALGPTLIHADFMNWGEPLLNKELWAMVALAKSHGVDTLVSTNFNSFRPQDADALLDSGLDRLVLSIDGLTQATYEKYRVGGDYARVVENLKALTRRRAERGLQKPAVVWQFLAFKHNEHEADAVRAFAKELGCDEVGVTPAYLPFRPGIKDEWLPTRPELRMYDPATFPDSPPWQWEAAKEEKSEVAVEVYKEPRKLCNWPWAGIAVNPDGSVSPCCSVEEQEYDFGNFFSGGFRRLWNNDKYRLARRHVRDYAAGKLETKPKSSHACERCFSIGQSRFQFPHSWLEEGKEPAASRGGGAPGQRTTPWGAWPRHPPPPAAGKVPA
jgi:radical SAM protein with 4Fe4S-binding SPASM domain